MGWKHKFPTILEKLQFQKGSLNKICSHFYKFGGNHKTADFKYIIFINNFDPLLPFINQGHPSLLAQRIRQVKSIVRFLIEKWKTRVECPLAFKVIRAYTHSTRNWGVIKIPHNDIFSYIEFYLILRKYSVNSGFQTSIHKLDFILQLHFDNFNKLIWVPSEIWRRCMAAADGDTEPLVPNLCP